MSEDAPYEETLAGIESVADESRDVESTLVTYSDERVTRLLGRRLEGLVVRVYGDDPESLPAAADGIAGSLGGIEGVEKAAVESPVTEDTLEVEVDIDRARSLGLKPGDVRRTAAILMSGITVGNLFEQQKVFDVVVWGTPQIRSSMEDLRSLPITTPAGEAVALSEVADVRLAPNPVVIRHESVSPYLDVEVTVSDGYDQTQVAHAVQAAVSSSELSLGLHARVLGDYSEEGAAQTTVLGLAGVAIITIYLLFQAAFNSWRLASLGMVGVAFAGAAGVVTLAVSTGEMTVGGLMGLLAGTGLVARGMILLVRRYQYLAGHGTAPGAGLIEQVAVDGMPSTTFALLSVIVIFLPMTLRMGAPGLEVAGPMALAVIGSSVGAGLFTLLALPALSNWWGRLAPESDSPDDLFAAIGPGHGERVLG